MAVIGQANCNGTYGSQYTQTLEVIVNSQNIANNTSNITITYKNQNTAGTSGNYGWANPATITLTDANGNRSQNYSNPSTDYRGGAVVILGSWTTDVAHGSDGKLRLNVSASFSSQSSSLSGGSVSGYLDLTDIPRKATINTATDFNDEGNPVITYTNNAGNSATTLQACISISSTDGSSIISYRDIPKTGNLSYTFNLTNSERDTLRNATPNSNTLTVYFFIKTIIGGITYYDKIQKTMTIINANPTFNNFTYEDTNTTTTALTGSNQICVLGYSNIKAVISSANTATANKGATMSKYQYVISGHTPIDIAYSSSSEVSGTINNVKNGTFTVYAIDSRGNSTPKQITASTINVKNYFNITLNANRSSVERSDNGVGGQVTLHYEGTFWNDNFGSTANTITSVAYAFKKTTDTQWTTGVTDITPTVSGNNFSFDGVIKSDNTDYSFDIDKSYNVIVAINDELSYYEINLIINSGTPNIAYADNGIAIMGDFDDNNDKVLQVNGGAKIKGSIDLRNVNDANIEWKEEGWGDKFRLIPDFGGGNDSNKFKIQGTVGGVDTDPTNWNDLLTVSGLSGNVEIAGTLKVAGSNVSGKYSTNEVIIGTWIDNKPIYRKVVNFTSGSSIQNFITINGITNVKELIRYSGYIEDSSTIHFSLPYSAGDGNNYVRTMWFIVNKNSNVIQEAHNNSAQSNKTVYFIAEYTKTTD